MNEIKLTDKEMYHIASSFFVMSILGFIIVRLIAYINISLLNPIMQFSLFGIALWSLSVVFRRYNKMRLIGN